MDERAEEEKKLEEVLERLQRLVKKQKAVEEKISRTEEALRVHEEDPEKEKPNHL